MSRFLLIVAIVLGFPLSGFAQFADKGEFVVVSKGIRLCSNTILDVSHKMLGREDRFWRVTSKARANGTQTVEALVLESSYDRKSGETTIEERQFDDDYAIRFKRVPGQKEILFMVSPRDGEVEATVEICKLKK